MVNIPYLWVPVTAVACYLFLLLTLLPASNDRAMRAFCGQLLCFVVWTGGSVFMRMLVWPGEMFWYEVSLVALFCIPAMIYRFCYAFLGCRRPGERGLVWLLTVLVAVPSVFDVYLEKPVLEPLAAGRSVFRYYIDWRVLIPTAICMGILLLAVRLIFRNAGKKKLALVIAGMVLLAVGNLVSVMPGNVFPFDTLSGILNAGFVFWALYRRNLFKMNIFLTPSTLRLLTVLVVCCLAFPSAHVLGPFLQSFLGTEKEWLLAPLFWCVTSIFTVLLNQLLYWIVQRFFLMREKQRSQVLQQFSAVTAGSTSQETLVRELLAVLERMFGLCQACIFLLDERGETFIPVYPPELKDSVEPIAKSDPCAEWFAGQCACVRVSQVLASGVHMARDKEEMARHYELSCIVPFRCELGLQGILFLGHRGGGLDYSSDDLMFLDSLGSMISVGLKNVRLYQRLFQEARIDQLTGQLNRRAFTEALNEQIRRGDPFALVMLDLDDFRLYNQLYGTHESDRALVRIAGLLRQQGGERAVLARYAGKVFMTILPGAGGEEGLAFARRMGAAVAALTNEKICGLTFSSGVCGYTGGAVSAQTMLDCVDMAVFEVKQSGKNGARLYGADTKGGNSPAQIEQSCASTIYAITAAIDAKDHYTFNHSQNVAKYARTLAGAIGMDPVQAQMIYQAGLVHDVGKLAVPEHILSKPGPLTDEEYRVMKGHVESSVDIIRNLPSLDYVVPAAVTHHERWDGRGYPHGLVGEDIPLGGRCLALADVFDAMINERAYKPAYSVEYALQQIREGAGTQFDPKLSLVFIRLVEEGVIMPITKR